MRASWAVDGIQISSSIWMCLSHCSPTPPAVGAQVSFSQNPSNGVGRWGSTGLHPYPVFHLLFQTNMKLLPQIKGESSSVIPYSLTNGVGRPHNLERENAGVQQLPLGTQTQVYPELETPPTSHACHGDWWLVQKAGILREQGPGLIETLTWKENVYPRSPWKITCVFVLF